jgi:chromosome segregation ATPase
MEEKNLEIERKQKYLENLNREVKMFNEQLPDVEKKLEIHQKTVELLKKNQDIAINNFEYLEPKWGYEKVPEYIENLKMLNVLSFEKANIDWKTQEVQLKNTIESITKQLEQAHKEIDKVTTELTELKGEGNGE